MLISKRVRRLVFLMKLFFTGLMISPAVTGEHSLKIVRVSQSQVFLELNATAQVEYIYEDALAMLDRCRVLLGEPRATPVPLVLSASDYVLSRHDGEPSLAPEGYAAVFRWWAEQTMVASERWLLDGLAHYHGYLMALERADAMTQKPHSYALHMRKAFFEDPRSGTISLLEASEFAFQKKYKSMLCSGAFLVMEGLHRALLQTTELDFHRFTAQLWQMGRAQDRVDCDLLIHLLQQHAPGGIDLIRDCVTKAGYPPNPDI